MKEADRVALKAIRLALEMHLSAVEIAQESLAKEFRREQRLRRLRLRPQRLKCEYSWGGTT